MYFSDTIEAIEAVKSYLDDDKNGMSCSCIIVYDNSKNTVIEKDHLGDWSPEKDCC